LKQGSMSVSEYVTHFTQLSHYAPVTPILRPKLNAFLYVC
jgi:hypothetical protein